VSNTGLPRILSAAVFLALFIHDGGALSAAEAENAPEIKVGGYLQLWALFFEQAENGLREPYTGDEAADLASGFDLNRARLDFDWSAGAVDGKVELRLEGTPGLLDAYGEVPILGNSIFFRAGQQKIPSSYEIAESSAELDFAVRSVISEKIGGYALSASPNTTSQLYNIKTYYRDLGAGVKADFGFLKLFYMLGNGLGANLWVGGREKKQYAFTNDAGAYFHGLRADFITVDSNSSIIQRLRFGGHFSINQHYDMVLNDERTVFDLERTSWSVDTAAKIFGRVRLTAMYGAGVVDDDFDADGKTDYEYSGWEVKAVVEVLPETFEAGARYEAFTGEFNENGAPGTLYSATIGVTWNADNNTRVQLDYRWKLTDSPSDPELGDNWLILVMQITF
jgi:hypothetical protein